MFRFLKIAAVVFLVVLGIAFFGFYLLPRFTAEANTVTLSSGGGWYPRPATNVNSNLGPGAFTMNASGSVAYLAQAPKSGAVCKVGIRFGTVTAPSNLMLWLETVSTSTGNPSGSSSLLAANTQKEIPSTAYSANNYFEYTLDASATVSMGQLFSVVVAPTSTATSTNIVINTSGSGFNQNFPYYQTMATGSWPYTGGGTWSKGGAPPELGLVYCDGTYGSQTYYPFQSYAGLPNISSSSNPNELGNVMNGGLPFPIKIDGAWVDSTSMVSSSQAAVFVYDSNNNVLASTSVWGQLKYSNNGNAEISFYKLNQTTAVIPANTNFRVTVKALQGNAFSIQATNATSTSLMDAFDGGSKWIATKSNDSVNWTNMATTSAMIGFHWVGADDAYTSGVGWYSRPTSYSSNNPGFNAFTMNASGTVAYVVQAPKSGDVCKIGIKFGTVTTPSNLMLWLETVSTSTGNPNGSSSLLASGAKKEIPSTAYSANNYFEYTLDASATVATGQYLSVVVAPTSTATSTNIQIHHQLGGVFVQDFPYTQTMATGSWPYAGGGSWTRGGSFVTPELGLVYCDGTYGPQNGFYPAQSVYTPPNVTSTEIGGVMNGGLPFPIQIDKVWLMSSMVASSQAAIFVYDSSNNVLASTSVWGQVKFTNNGNNELSYYTLNNVTPVISANTTFRITAHGLGGGSFNIPSLAATSTAAMSAFEGGSNWIGTKSNDSVNWTNIATTSPIMGFHWFMGVIGDTSPPTPNPMAFASPFPTSIATSSLTMSATSSTSDATPPISYLFANVSCATFGGTGGASSTGFVSSPYTNSGLQVNKCYAYQIQARDSVTPTPNTGTASASSSAYTAAVVPGSPTPSAPSTSTLTLLNAENGNPTSSPSTSFAVQASSTDANWNAYWVNNLYPGSGNATSVSAVWAGDASWDSYVVRNLSASTTYAFRVQARNQDLATTTLGAAGSGTTSPLPGQPGTPTYSSVGSSTLAISWATSTNANYYKLERATSSQAYVQITTTTANSYNDSGLTPNTSFFYRARGSLNGGGDGPYSATSSQLLYPAEPGTPTYTNVSTSTLTVNWASSTAGASYYRLERATSTQAYIEITTSTGNSYGDSGLTASSTYFYRVRGNNATGNGPYSASSSVSTTSGGDTSAPTPNPMAFASPFPTSIGTSSVTMSATSSASDATPPINYLFINTPCATFGGTGGASSTGFVSSPYTNSSLQVNKCYAYQIQARDSVVPTPNTGTASASSSAYTAAVVPGAPTLSAPSTSTLTLLNAENGNPTSSPSTSFAVQASSTDANWNAYWVNNLYPGSGNATSASAVWAGDASWDSYVVRNLSASTTYAFRVQARNQDLATTTLGAAGSGTTSAGDTSPPTPNPMAFASPFPTSVTTSSMTISATSSAADASPPIQYNFINVSCASNGGSGGTTSGYSTATSTTDTGLEVNKCYAFTIQARDAVPNTGTASASSSAYTAAVVPGAPTLSAPSTSTLTFTNSPNGNPTSSPSTAFAVFVSSTSPTDPDWDGFWVNSTRDGTSTSAVFQGDSSWNGAIVNLSTSTTYTFKVQARNQDLVNTVLGPGGSGTTSAGGGGTPLSMQVGYYMGTGTTTVISGVGFQPQLMIVNSEGNVATPGASWSSSAMPGGSTRMYFGSTSGGDSGIVVNSGGFTVKASGNSLSAIDARYAWAAFAGSDCSAAGQFCVGSYTGDGTASKSVTSVGFQPDLIWIKGTGATNAVWRSSAMPDNTNAYFWATAGVSTSSLIQTLDSTGFTVGANSAVNTNGTTYYFAAFKNVTGKMNVGSYMGDGTDNRNISGVGFVPDFLFIKNNASTTSAVFSTEIEFGDKTLSFINSNAVTNAIQLLQADGFQLGSRGLVNESSSVSYYAAFGGATDPSNPSGTFTMDTGSYTGNGTTSTINVAINPDLVIVKNRSTSTEGQAVARTSMVSGLFSWHLASTTGVINNGIVSLGTSTFTVGTSTDTNASGEVYDWQAFGNAFNPRTATGSADFAIGMYGTTAQDNTNITRAGFQPDLVVAKNVSAAAAVVWRSSAQSGDLSGYFKSGNAEASDIIQALNADGFQIGTANAVNQSGANVYWFAFKDGANFTVNNYTGTGGTQNITSPGFQPDLVWVKSTSTAAGVFRPSTLSGDATLYFSASSSVADRITGFLSNGFSVGGNQIETNTSGKVYRYMAWKIPTGGGDTSPPTPNPMAFASPFPTSITTSSLTMSATSSASDATPPINYLFINTPCATFGGTGGASSTGFVSSPYTNSGLQVNKCYAYQIQARDSATPTPNTGTASASSSAYTAANVPGAPTLSAPSTSTLTLLNAENGNPTSSPSTGFAIFVSSTSPTDPDWDGFWVNFDRNTTSATPVFQGDSSWNGAITNLTASTTYTFKVEARNQDLVNTVLGAGGSGTTASSGNPPNAPTLDAPASGIQNFSDTAGVFNMTAADPQSNNIQYDVVIYTDSGCNTQSQDNNQNSPPQTGWSGQNAQCSVPNDCYTSGTQGTFTLVNPLSQNFTYYWKARAIDPTGSGTWGSYSACSSGGFTTTNGYWTTNSGSWSVSSSQLTVTPLSGSSVQLRTGQSVMNGVVDVKIKSSATGTNTGNTGPFARAGSPSGGNSDRYQLSEADVLSGKERIGKRISNAYTNITSSTFAFSGGTFYQFRGYLSGNFLQSWINGGTTISGNDSSLSSAGFWGLEASSTNGTATFTYDNFAFYASSTIYLNNLPGGGSWAVRSSTSTIVSGCKTTASWDLSAYSGQVPIDYDNGGGSIAVWTNATCNGTPTATYLSGGLAADIFGGDTYSYSGTGGAGGGGAVTATSTIIVSPAGLITF